MSEAKQVKEPVSGQADATRVNGSGVYLKDKSAAYDTVEDTGPAPAPSAPVPPFLIQAEPRAEARRAVPPVPMSQRRRILEEQLADIPLSPSLELSMKMVYPGKLPASARSFVPLSQIISVDPDLSHLLPKKPAAPAEKSFAEKEIDRLDAFNLGNGKSANEILEEIRAAHKSAGAPELSGKDLTLLNAVTMGGFGFGDNVADGWFKDKAEDIDALFAQQEKREEAAAKAAAAETKAVVAEMKSPVAPLRQIFAAVAAAAAVVISAFSFGNKAEYDAQLESSNPVDPSAMTALENAPPAPPAIANVTVNARAEILSVNSIETGTEKIHCTGYEDNAQGMSMPGDAAACDTALARLLKNGTSVVPLAEKIILPEIKFAVTQMEVLDIIGKGLEQGLRKNTSGINPQTTGEPVALKNLDVAAAAQDAQVLPVPASAVTPLRLDTGWKDGQKTAAFNTAAALDAFLPALAQGPLVPVAPVADMNGGAKVLTSQELKERGVADDVIRKIESTKTGKDSVSCDVVEGRTNKNTNSSLTGCLNGNRPGA